MEMKGKIVKPVQVREEFEWSKGFERPNGSLEP